jgi:hypothetical protein
MGHRTSIGAELSVELRDLLCATLLELCERGDRLPYRRSVPWLVLADWARTDLLDERWRATFLQHTGTTNAASLILHATDRALAVEDGMFYRHGGTLAPERYIASTRSRAQALRDQG